MVGEGQAPRAHGVTEHHEDLRERVAVAVEACPRCRRLSSAEKDARIAEVIADVHAQRARKLEHLPDVVWGGLRPKGRNGRMVRQARARSFDRSLRRAAESRALA